jgi:hypothetical protein
MKTSIDGVAITPAIIAIFGEWYNQQNQEDVKPRVYVRWLAKVQDYLTRIWVDKDDEEDMSELKSCVDYVIQIKDELERFYAEDESDN